MSKEIDDFINEQVAAGRGTKQQILEQFAKSDDADLVAYATNANKPAVEETKKVMGNLLTAPHPTLGISPADVALTAGAAAIAWQAGKKAVDLASQGLGALGGQIFGKAGPAAPPVPSASTQDLMALPNVEKPPAYPPEIQALIERSEANKAAKAADAAAKANPLPQGMTPGVPSAANPMNDLTAQPPAYPLIQPKQSITPSVAETVAIGGNVDQAVKQVVADELDAVSAPQELRTGTGKLAYAGQGPAAEIRAKGKKAGEPMLRNNYARVEDVPAGYAFVPGAQHIDTSRTNIGQTEYTKAYTNRPFPSTNELAVQESNEINRLLGRPTRAEAKAAGITLPPQTPGITKHVLESKGTPFMGTKAAKVGGVLGALIAIPDLVNAQTAGQRGMAGANMLEAVLPPGFTMSNVGEGSSNIPNVNAAALLGSPYAQTDWAKTQRLREKAGAGRGIAPPSAYKR